MNQLQMSPESFAVELAEAKTREIHLRARIASLEAWADDERAAFNAERAELQRERIRLRAEHLELDKMRETFRQDTRPAHRVQESFQWFPHVAVPLSAVSVPVAGPWTRPASPKHQTAPSGLHLNHLAEEEEEEEEEQSDSFQQPSSARRECAIVRLASESNFLRAAEAADPARKRRKTDPPVSPRQQTTKRSSLSPPSADKEPTARPPSNKLLRSWQPRAPRPPPPTAAFGAPLPSFLCSKSTTAWEFQIPDVLCAVAAHENRRGKRRDTAFGVRLPALLLRDKPRDFTLPELELDDWVSGATSPSAVEQLAAAGLQWKPYIRPGQEDYAREGAFVGRMRWS
ncbi:hypothetical protein C8R44DRAFT_795088 [Mycena epipterygia]|nr:hypothetical protein C8R44DRAFT_795088 [Mycena epipterygia]